MGACGGDQVRDGLLLSQSAHGDVKDGGSGIPSSVLSSTNSYHTPGIRKL